MRFQRLTECFVGTVKSEGLTRALSRVAEYVSNRDEIIGTPEDAKNARNNTGKLLMVNGCSALHPARYRVNHQYEQLKKAGVPCQKINYLDVDDSLAEKYEVLYIFRCMYKDQIRSLIKRAHDLKKIVIFDIDDLVIDTAYTDGLDYVKNLSREQKNSWDRNVLLMRETLLECDAAVSPTERLQEELNHKVKNSYVWRNLASDEMVRISEEAYSNYCNKDNIIRIGYFSGSTTHNADFNIIKPAICRILAENKDVHLVLVGELDDTDELQQFEAQVETEKSVTWRQLPYLIRKVDINLAPLELNEFNECKSEIKWIEASLVRVPTIASDVGAFHNMIEPDQTGILCENTKEAWYLSIKRLIESPELRTQLADNAYKFVRSNCTTEAKSTGFETLVNQIQNDVMQLKNGVN